MVAYVQLLPLCKILMQQWLSQRGPKHPIAEQITLMQNAVMTPRVHCGYNDMPADAFTQIIDRLAAMFVSPNVEHAKMETARMFV